jgi:hypothetical protein
MDPECADRMPAGWTIDAAWTAVKLDDRGHSGDFRLTHLVVHQCLCRML